jgi:hypothetical protein
MGYVLGIKQNGTLQFHPDIRKDRRDVLFVKYLLIGPKILIVHAVTTN